MKKIGLRKKEGKMIIDAHAHAFPHQGGAAGYESAETYLRDQQSYIEKYWGRMLTNTLDEKYKALPDEDVNFRVGKFGRYYWTKNGRECWLQRCPTMMIEMEWTPEQMVAFMDSIGVDKAVLHVGYMEKNYCREYFADCVSKWPDRLVGTASIDYDIEKSEEYREGELAKLRDAVQNKGMRGAFQAYPRHQNTDDPKFDPFWTELSDLKIPHIFWTGFQPKGEYLKFLARIESGLRRYPDAIGIISHLGGNIKPPGDPDFVDTPNEMLSLLALPNVYFEVGYVLSYERWESWKENYEYPYPLHTDLIKKVYDQIGAERLLWASDMPFVYRTCTYRQLLDLVRLHFDFLNEEEKRLVIGGNAARVFRI
jgi:predicted TIM-barrel fold metal-dependent hydrolase